MLKFIIILLLISLSLSQKLESDSGVSFFNPALKDDIETVNCGISVAISENFFNRLLKELLPEILEIVSKELKSDKTFEINLDMMLLYIKDPHFTLNEIKFDVNNTKADLYSQNNSIGFHIVDSKINATIDYEVFVDPPILEDTGSVQVGFDGLNIDLIFGMGPDEKDPEKFDVQISQSAFSVDPKSVRIEIDNQNDFNKLIVSVINAVLPPIANLVGTALSEYLQKLVDLISGAIPNPITVDKISVDLSFKEFPEVTEDDFLSLTWVGKVSPKDDDIPFKNVAQLPKWIPDGKDLQVFISDYTLKTALVTVAELDLLDLSISDKDTSIMNTDYLGTFFPEMLKYFGKHQPCSLNFKLDDEILPDLSITAKGIDSSLSLILDLSSMKDNKIEEAFKFRVESKINAILDIDRDLVIKMKINKLDIKVSEIIHSNIGDIETKKVNTIMSLLLNLIKTLINATLSRGIDLGFFIRDLPVVLKDILVSPNKGYYMIQANPYFDADTLMNMMDQHGLGSSNTDHSDIIKDSLAKGMSAFYETFDKEEHLNRPGTAGLKALINAFDLFKVFTHLDKE